MAILYWSAVTLFWELSIDHNMDVQYQVLLYMYWDLLENEYVK